MQYLAGAWGTAWEEKALEKSPKSPLAPLSTPRGSKSSKTLDVIFVADIELSAFPNTSANKSLEPFSLEDGVITGLCQFNQGK